MPIDPKHLLDLANRLVGTAPGAPESDLRRGISTAYYALFHLLIFEACLNWSNDISRPGLARMFRPRRDEEGIQEDHRRQ